VIGVPGESVGLVTAVRRGVSFCWEEEERVEIRMGARRSIVSAIWAGYGAFPVYMLVFRSANRVDLLRGFVLEVVYTVG